MLTVPFKTIINGVLSRAGIVPADAPEADVLAIIDFAADRFKTAYEFYRWPVYTFTEQRFFRPVYSEAIVYQAGTEVYYTPLDAYYKAVSTTTAGQDPEDTPAKWEVLQNFNHQVDYEQAGQTAIEAVLFAYDKDPRADKSARKIPFKLLYNGVGFAPDCNLTSVWLEYRPRAPDFHARLYAIDTETEVGERVYFPDDGEVYLCLEAAALEESPETDADKFQLIEFPDFLARAVKAGALTDWDRGGEKEKSAKMEALQEDKFTELLEDQVWQITKLQGQTGRPNTQPNS